MRKSMEAIVLVGASLAPIVAGPALPGGAAAAQEAGADSSAVLLGRVVDAGSLEPLEGARVRLSGRDRSTVTNALGRFRIPGLRPGSDTLSISTLDGIDGAWAVRLQAGGTTRAELRVRSDVVEVEALEVTVEQGPPDRLDRLERRLGDRVGRVITRDQLAEHGGPLSFVFRGMAGVEVAPTRRGEFRVRLRRRMGRGYCRPELFLNGRPSAVPTVDDLTDEELAAIEVFTVDVLPSEFSTTARSRECGAIALWTRAFVQ